MNRRIAILVVAGMLLGTAAVSAADLPPLKWWRHPEITKQLALTDDQQARLDTIFRNSANELIDLRAEADKLSIALHGELDRPQLNRQVLQNLAARLSDAHGKLFSRELMMLVDMRSVLTDDQWDKLRTQLDQQRGRSRGQRAPK